MASPLRAELPGRWARRSGWSGFRDIAVHLDPSLQLPITVAIIETHWDEFLQYSQTLLRRDSAGYGP